VEHLQNAQIRGLLGFEFGVATPGATGRGIVVVGAVPGSAAGVELARPLQVVAGLVRVGDLVVVGVELQRVALAFQGGVRLSTPDAIPGLQRADVLREAGILGAPLLALDLGALAGCDDRIV
jgi:hypothetical protein